MFTVPSCSQRLELSEQRPLAADNSTGPRPKHAAASLGKDVTPLCAQTQLLIISSLPEKIPKALAAHSLHAGRLLARAGTLSMTSSALLCIPRSSSE